MAINESRPAAQKAERSRRDVLKAGVTAVPIILTLHAAPAWAATDYTMSAYRYGVNAGLCRNPSFQPGSSSPWKKDEFMPCEQIKRSGGSRISWESETTDPTGSGPQQISF